MSNISYIRTADSKNPIFGLAINPLPAPDSNQVTDLPKPSSKTSAIAQLVQMRQTLYRTQTDSAPLFDPTPAEQQHQQDVVYKFFKDEYGLVGNFQDNLGPQQQRHVLEPAMVPRGMALHSLSKIQQKLGRSLTDDEIKQLSNDFMYACYTNSDNAKDGTEPKGYPAVIQQVEDKWTNPHSDPFSISDKQKSDLRLRLEAFRAGRGYLRTVGDHDLAIVEHMLQDLITAVQAKIGRPLTDEEFGKLIDETCYAVINNDLVHNASLQSISKGILQKWSSYNDTSNASVAKYAKEYNVSADTLRAIVAKIHQNTGKVVPDEEIEELAKDMQQAQAEGKNLGTSDYLGAESLKLIEEFSASPTPPAPTEGLFQKEQAAIKKYADELGVNKKLLNTMVSINDKLSGTHISDEKIKEFAETLLPKR